MGARDRFTELGVRVVIVADQDEGAQAFLDVVTGGADGAEAELYIDDGALFKAAMGGRQVSNWWLLKPSVAMRVLSLARLFGNDSGDINRKASVMGGEILVGAGDSGVLAEWPENSKFGHASLEELLDAARTAGGSASE